MSITTKKQLYKHLFKVIIVCVVLISITTASLAPQVVKTQGFSLSLLSQIFGKNDVEGEILEPSFPAIEDIEPRRTIIAVMTAYSSDVGQTDSTPCIPADWTYNLCENYEQTGAQDTIAANFLPLGTKVRFPDLYGDKIFTVRDRMNERYGNGRGDIWMPTRQEAKVFGVKRVKMEIYYR